MRFGIRQIPGAGSVAAVAAVLLVAGCKSSTAPLGACTDAVVLTVEVHTAVPRFDWSPGCLLYRVEVQDTSGTTVWAVQADSGNAIGPVVTYGVRPAGTGTEPVPPATLVSGHQYNVGVFRYVATDSSTDLLAAYLFTQP